ncbi:MAG: histidinol-phosphate transaminase [Acidobacteriia bacterium]|nr:histidinol-phosphate transaminase [Terriglobia bacterium]
MSKFEDLVPDYIRKLPGYVPGKPIKQAELESGTECIKMASNENPFGPSPKALQAMHEAAGEANFYPDNEITELRLRLAELNQVDINQVMVSNGSTAFLNIIARALLRPGLNAVTSERSFIVYPIATGATGADFITVPMKDHTFDLEAIAARVNADTRIVFIANPNNPTGTMVDAKAIDRFLDRLPDHVVTVLDEAYCDFATDFARERGIEYSHSLDYVREGRSVVVLRTFSKAHGLAGARVGYGFASERMITYFVRLQMAFAVSGMAEAAALAALEDEAHIRRTVENNRAGAKWLLEKFRDLGILAVPTSANFIYFEVDDAASVAKKVQAGGVIIRPLTGGWGCPNALRVTIGTPEQNERFILALAKATERASVGR